MEFDLQETYRLKLLEKWNCFSCFGSLAYWVDCGGVDVFFLSTIPQCWLGWSPAKKSFGYGNSLTTIVTHLVLKNIDSKKFIPLPKPHTLQRSEKTEGKQLHISQTSFLREMFIQPIYLYLYIYGVENDETICWSCRGIRNDFPSHRHWVFQVPCPHQVHQPQHRSNFRRLGVESIGKTGWILQHFVWEEPVIASRPLNSTLVWPTIYPLGMLLLEWWLNMHLGLSRKSSRRTSLLQSKSDSRTILSIVGITAPMDIKEAKIDGNS